METKKYQLAIYMRLSKGDDKSIAVQRLFLQKFVEENFVDYELQEFCDNGYSGTNFERPAIQKLLKLAKNNKIDCIVVKDFSRFARDYIELGSYIEQIFPFLGVRFISVNDNYDSDNYDGTIAGIDMNFKSLLYDLYSRDLSQKVRSALSIRKEQGIYVSANEPFGYKKASNDRHLLVIEEDEAFVVRKIFSMSEEGKSILEIAKYLNDNNIKTPIEFKIKKGKTKKVPKRGSFSWNYNTVYHILKNEIYMGNIVQKKYKKNFVGGKNHLRPYEEWIRKCNHHEPIINR